MENNITDSQKEKIQKLLLEIIQKVQGGTILVMDDAEEMYINSLKTEVGNNIKKFKKIMGNGKMLESDLKNFASTGLEADAVGDVIFDIFNENGLIIK